MSETKKTIKIDLNNIDLPSETEEKETNKTKQADSESKKSRFYLPVLNLNNKNHWTPLPSEEREYWTDKKAFETCVGNCCGNEGLKAGCCYLDLDDLEHVLGPIKDEDIARIIRAYRIKGFNLSREDVVIDFEEGKLIGEKYFNGHEIFKNPASYPFLGFKVIGPRLACVFLNAKTGLCGIYPHRPDMCKGYLCQYVQTRFLVRTPDKPNTWKKIR